MNAQGHLQARRFHSPNDLVEEAGRNLRGYRKLSLRYTGAPQIFDQCCHVRSFAYSEQSVKRFVRQLRRDYSWPYM